MPNKKPNESYQQYRERVIDPISESFCAAKWYNATIWLGSGMTTSCHHPLPHHVSATDVVSNPKLLHNTPHKKEMRKLMQDGHRPHECEYCWKIEDIKRDNVSDRVFKTVLYKDEDIAAAGRMDWRQDVNLKTLEIAFDRTCQFACSYCNPAFSSTWVKDLKQHGAYQDLTSDGRNHYTHAHDDAQLFKFNEENPYINAFWEWWPELSQSLMELRVTGGEPTMSGDFWKLLDWFKDNMGSKMRFATNSNLGMKQDLLEKLIDRAQYIEDFQVYTSCEATGAIAEYIRDGLDYAQWKRNAERLIEEGKIKTLHMMMTINALCLYSITDFLDDLLVWKQRYGRDFPVFSVNILRFPSFQSPLMLPDEMRSERKAVIEAWFEKNKDSPLLHQFETTQLQRLIDYLDVVKTPHMGASAQAELQRDFKNFHIQYDARRGKNFVETFPMLADWYNSIEVKK